MWQRMESFGGKFTSRTWLCRLQPAQEIQVIWVLTTELLDSFDTIISYAHMWNWAPDWVVAKEIYACYPESYSVLTPFAYTYLEELLRSTSSEYGRTLRKDDGSEKRRKVGRGLVVLAVDEHPNDAEYIAVIKSIEHYFDQSTSLDSGNNRNSTLHGYMHPRYWTKESFETLIGDIARFSPYAGF